MIVADRVKAAALALALAGGLGMATGAALTLVNDHLAPWGLERKRAVLDRALNDPASGARARLAAMTADRDGWKAANGRCEAKRTEEAAEASKAVSAASSVRQAASAGAFDQGYAAGRVAGRKSCGASNAKSGDDPGHPGPGGVRDQDGTAAWNAGAYRPGG